MHANGEKKEQQQQPEMHISKGLICSFFSCGLFL